jgi:23S rRNA (adenine2503-C2)-methyltransferase
VKHPLNHIFSHTPESLTQWCADHNMPAFRAKQILEWVYQKGVTDPAKMSNLGKLDREVLASHMTFLSGDVLAHQVATDGTQKLLIQWNDGDAAPGASTPASPEPLVRLPLMNARVGGDTSRQTECVMIPSPAPEGSPSVDDRFTACISSQVGCPVGCKFCASGLGGLDGNLSSGRIVEQVYRLRWQLNDLVKRHPDPAAREHAMSVRRITNVVFMGMGEPLSNLSNVVPAVRSIAALWGMGISARKITISTVGLPKAIEKLADQLDLPVTLALSLHAPNDELRRQLIPWAEYTTIKDLLAACHRWFEKTGREITLEYTLLRGVNDRPEHAVQLAQVARSLRANINLIRYNEVKGMPFERPRTEDVRAFQEILRSKSVNAHIRASRGRDIAAACGQLRHEKAAV